MLIVSAYGLLTANAATPANMGCATPSLSLATPLSPQVMVSVSDGLRLRSLVARHTSSGADEGSPCEGGCRATAVRVQIPADSDRERPQPPTVEPAVMQAIHNAIASSGADMSKGRMFQVRSGFRPRCASRCLACRHRIAGWGRLAVAAHVVCSCAIVRSHKDQFVSPPPTPNEQVAIAGHLLRNEGQGSPAIAGSSTPAEAAAATPSTNAEPQTTAKAKEAQKSTREGVMCAVGDRVKAVYGGNQKKYDATLSALHVTAGATTAEVDWADGDKLWRLMELDKVWKGGKRCVGPVASSKGGGV